MANFSMERAFSGGKRILLWRGLGSFTILRPVFRPRKRQKAYWETDAL
jgi:hypothetical protein